MSERFEYGETDLFEWVEDNGEMISTKECVNKLNEQQTEIDNLKEENGQLRQFINKGRRLSVKEIMDNANGNELLKKKIRGFEKENEQLKEELQRFKKYVFTQDNILCYKCEHCIKKDIYVVDCEMKGEVDVHGLCGWFREVKV